MVDFLAQLERAGNWRGCRNVCAKLLRRRQWEPVLEHAKRVLGTSLQGNSECEHDHISCEPENAVWVARCKVCGKEHRSGAKHAAIDGLADDGDTDRGEACVHAARILSDLSRIDGVDFDELVSFYILAMTALNSEWLSQLMGHQDWQAFMPDIDGSAVYPGALDGDGRVCLYLDHQGVHRLQPHARAVLPAPK